MRGQRRIYYVGPKFYLRNRDDALLFIKALIQHGAVIYFKPSIKRLVVVPKVMRWYPWFITPMIIGPSVMKKVTELLGVEKKEDWDRMYQEILKEWARK